MQFRFSPSQLVTLFRIGSALALLTAVRCTGDVSRLAAEGEGLGSNAMQFEAETFPIDASLGQIFSDPQASGGQGLLMWSNATTTRTLSLPGTASLMMVRARSSYCQGASQIVVSVDGTQYIGRAVDAGDWTNYSVNVNLAAGSHSVTMGFTNDFSTDSCDRNLYLDNVTFLPGTVHKIEAESLVAQIGTNGDAEVDSAASGGKQLFMWSNASARIQVSSSSLVSGLVVRAKETDCNGAANLRITIDGTPLSTTAIPSPDWAEYAFPVTLGSGTHNVDFAYTNDLKVSGTCDRNLGIDWVEWVESGCSSAACTDGKAIYVATWGNDKNNGAQDTPFLTLGKAASLAKAGTTIYLRGGTFKGAQSVMLVGAAGQPVLMMPFPGESVTFSGTGSTLSANTSLLTIHDSAHAVISGFEVANSNARGVDVYDSNDVTLEGFSIHDTQGRGLGGEGDNLTFQSNEIYRAAMSNAGGWKDSAGYGWAAAVSTWVKSDGSWNYNLTFKDNHIHDNWGECLIALFVDGATISGNRIHDCWSVNLYLDNVRNVVAEKNQIYATTDTYNRPSLGVRAAGINMSVEYYDSVTSQALENIRLSNNLVSAVGAGITFWFDSRNWVSTNTYRTLTVENNVVHSTARGIAFDAVQGPAAAPYGAKFRNNIAYQGWASKSSFALGNSGAWSIGANVWPDGVPTVAKVSGNFQADPSFTNPVAGGPPEGYHLKAGSPCVGAGNAATDPQDFWGNSRPTKPAIGIHEP